MCFYYLQEKQCDKPINQMEQFISFIRKEWFHIIRDRKTLFILFGMPLVQIIIFGFALTNEVKNAHIAVLDLSGDQVTTRIYSELAASSNFEIVESLHSYDQIDASLKSGKVKMVVVFPCNFKQDLMHNKYVQIQLIADASDPNTATTLVNYASAIIQDFQMNYFGYTLPLVIQPQLRMLYNPQLKGEFNFVPRNKEREKTLVRNYHRNCPDCGNEMIFHGRDSIGRLISGESLLLGSTEDNTIVAFFVLRVWYRTIQPYFFLLLTILHYFL
jgi:hypothetical protein